MIIGWVFFVCFAAELVRNSEATSGHSKIEQYNNNNNNNNNNIVDNRSHSFSLSEKGFTNVARGEAIVNQVGLDRI
jgi:hypothetical protein